jgi:hypothetical protein
MNVPFLFMDLKGIAFIIRFLVLQLIMRFVLISTFLFSLGGSHSKFPEHDQCLLLMDTTARVDGVGRGENPGGQGREREEREVVEGEATQTKRHERR